MKLNKTLAGLLFSALTLPALAQPSKAISDRELTDIVLNYKGKDTVLFRNGVKKYPVFYDEQTKEYKYLELSDDQNTKKKPSLTINKRVLQDALNYKNIVGKYSNLEEAMLDITRETNIPLPSIVENKIKDYFNKALQYYDKGKAGSGPVLVGDARQYVIDCRDAVKRAIDTTKTDKSKHNIAYLVEYTDKLLNETSTVADIDPGIYKTREGDIIVAIEYEAYVADGQNRPNVRLLTRTKLISYVQTEFKKDVSNQLFTKGAEIIDSKEETSRLGKGTQIHAKAVARYNMIKNPEFTDEVLKKLQEYDIELPKK